MAFELPSLPYPPSALAERGMQQETLELHHGKHRQRQPQRADHQLDAGLATLPLHSPASAFEAATDSRKPTERTPSAWTAIRRALATILSIALTMAEPPTASDRLP